MAKITQAVFLYLAGKTPPRLRLPELRTSRSTFATIRSAFKHYLAIGVEWTYCEDIADLPPSAGAGLSVIYLMGHAWLQDGAFSTSVKKSDASVEVAGDEVISFLLPYLKGSALLFFDTCNAASIAPLLELPEYQGVAAVFGSAADESALEFPLDSATRLAITLNHVIRPLPGDTDVSSLAIQTARRIQADSVMASQTVSYLPARPPILLSKTSAEQTRRVRSRTYIVVRSLLVSVGVGLACAIAGVLWYWRFHVQVEIQAPPLAIVDGPLSIEVRSQSPDLNANELIETEALLPGNTLRLRLPAEDLLFVVKARYRDGGTRAIRFQSVSRPTFSSASKFIHFELPKADEIGSHPDMAFVPVTEWLSGPDRTVSHNRASYWIDIYPPTVSVYLPQAQAAVAEGSLEIYESVLVYKIQASNGLAATGLTQVGKLSTDLADVFHIIDAPARATRTPQTLSENRLMAAHIPCPECPAPMTMKEAELFCKKQGKRLPTAEEWELAARGTDGRLYPWGNRFEKTRANVIGLPDKGEEFGLKSVYAFPSGESPFGILGGIGNAGQWFDSEGGYDRSYIGGNYRFNPQDSLVYSTMPETGDPMPLLEVTTRCVSSLVR
jgi:hypothetical protein